MALQGITCIVDNAVTAGSRCWGEHGVAFLIEMDGARVLFDTGSSGTVLLHNLDALEIAPESLDALAISHAHYDHTGGLAALAPLLRPATPLYAHTELLRARYSRDTASAAPTSIGLPYPPEALEGAVTLQLSAAAQEIAPGLWTSGEITQRREPEGRSASHGVLDGDTWQPDPYRDDMSLVAELDNELVLICGCCHAGLLNTLAHVERVFTRPVRTIIGGTHLGGADAAQLDHVAGALTQMPDLAHVYLNHCSGHAAYLALVDALGAEVVQPLPAAARLDVARL
jgi:7,8-dihydropterin-6-yl-methyl-4-(beta-D-ribofuranosyl)aminobenzene 5'-phosphate synthase